MSEHTDKAIVDFLSKSKEKLENPNIHGEPEDQLRGPFEALILDMALSVQVPSGSMVVVGETSVSDLKTRPDFAVTVNNTLIGFIELKAPGKGGDPRRFKAKHDKEQWQKLRSLPNLIYSDGIEFSLWQDGEIVGSVVRLNEEMDASGVDSDTKRRLNNLFEQFLYWEPVAPRNVKELALVSARLCRLLRHEVAEQLGLGSEALTSLATDWRRLLFPEASDEAFADGYAQAVTFGMLMARARDISLTDSFEVISKELAKTSTIIGTALKLLTDNAENRKILKTSLGTLRRVFDVVHWPTISKGNPESWLYFYEDFLEVYDNELRKKTGSYYTPPEVVRTMVRLVDEVLKSPRFNLHAGIASPSVTIADPATGTGTFLLEAFRRIAETVRHDQGEGAVAGVVTEAINRLIAFEMQLGPFAVAQLRIMAELEDILGVSPSTSPRMFVTNTLGDPNDDESWIPGILAPIAKSRKDANKIKRETPITVVLGNPPYREKAKGMGGWIEGKTKAEEKTSPMSEWMPPKSWNVGLHAKHLRNLYIYFWRWATWKVFDHHQDRNTGVVCYITVAGFLSGPGFQKMRDYLRRTCDEIWVIDCSPEGYQPAISTRIFQGVQQPVCIVLASRTDSCDPETPALVRYHSLTSGHRKMKYEELGKLTFDRDSWVECPKAWREPFLPVSTGEWTNYPALDDLFMYNGAGVMPGRTWVIAPDKLSLQLRWERLADAPMDQKQDLFHPHLVNGEPGDKHVHRIVDKPLFGFSHKTKSVAEDQEQCIDPVRYGFRSFDRQWIIPDSRVINRPNPKLWEIRSDKQIYMTVFTEESPSSGPALVTTALIPDLHHYKGSFGGRVFPLWVDRFGRIPNVKSGLLAYLSKAYGKQIYADDVVAYLIAIAAHPEFTARFQDDLTTPGLRIPFTAHHALFVETASVGRRVIWLHTYGERMADPSDGRPFGPPRMPERRRPTIPLEGAIPTDTDRMPDSIEYNSETKRLHVGDGYVENVEPAVWQYEVSGKQVIPHWFSYRKKNRERPIIGKRRPPSALNAIQPDHWLPEYTTDLINLLNVIGLLVDLEPVQADLLERICSGDLIAENAMRAAGAFDIPEAKAKRHDDQHTLS